MDSGVEIIPAWLEELERDSRLEIRWTENLGPYRKLLPVMTDVAEKDIVVTCDDDVVYGREWLTALLDQAVATPRAVVCAQARIPIRNFFGRLQSYVHWPRVSTPGDHRTAIPIGAGGIAYRKPLLDMKFLTWREFLRTAPMQDDLWFREASRRRGTTVEIAAGANEQVFPIKAGTALSDVNVSSSGKTDHRSFFTTYSRRATYRLAAYAGAAVCRNDVVWRAVERASAVFDRGDEETFSPRSREEQR